MSELVAPAETYTINVLASALGRFSVKDISRSTVEQTVIIFDESLENLMTEDIPKVPHTEPELLRQAINFDNKILQQINLGPASIYLSRDRLKFVLEAILNHIEYCQNLLISNGSNELLVDPVVIAKSFELPDLWDNAISLVNSEINYWGIDRLHPAVPEELQQRVTLDETKSLIEFIWRDIFKLKTFPNVSMHMVETESNYHVFWSPTAECLDYATPASYDLATQLSYDVPHNAAHLAHLAILDTSKGALTYKDEMAQRAYFEAVAVLTEYIFTQVAISDENFGSNIATTLNIANTTTFNSEDLKNWIILDRSYEFKLRAARLYSDVLMLQGLRYEDAVEEVAAKFRIPKSHAEGEIKKYLPWTGLGGIYTHGYRKLLGKGIVDFQSAINNSNGKVMKGWSDYDEA